MILRHRGRGTRAASMVLRRSKPNASTAAGRPTVEKGYNVVPLRHRTTRTVRCLGCGDRLQRCVQSPVTAGLARNTLSGSIADRFGGTGLATCRGLRSRISAKRRRDIGEEERVAGPHANFESFRRGNPTKKNKERGGLHILHVEPARAHSGATARAWAGRGYRRTSRVRGGVGASARSMRRGVACRSGHSPDRRPETER